MKNLNGKESIEKEKIKSLSMILICIVGLEIGGVFIGDASGDISKNSSKKNQIKSSNNVLICDGINVIEDCELNGKQYTLYKYYPAVEEKSHTETVAKYKKEITRYCTLCKDGTYSPTCATGSGACSHHGGVAQWNAPIYSQVPYYEQIKLIDTPAVAERYEIIEKN